MTIRDKSVSDAEPGDLCEIGVPGSWIYDWYEGDDEEIVMQLPLEEVRAEGGGGEDLYVFTVSMSQYGGRGTLEIELEEARVYRVVDPEAGE